MFDDKIHTHNKYLFLNTAYSIPTVQILLGGSDSSILGVYEATRRKIPVIVITGTGGTADLVTDEYRYLYGEDQNQSEENYSHASEQNQFTD
ncbi:unnamed protein product [Rotaria sp. Silwood2]|nr:unnamed protein product [Rotaria sp. Silwood2]CAF3000997.1 unnamed protein product [Rotaria sp. Silwood2]CAF3160756.1 unnamed protein product [Rotaria sp. Silwood2]CAF4056399.1 unnamed protein product [Rotaria sp. Silwood2]CAF4214858.1 unnamed protein product [Rotaria sp. Silwood2]